MRVDKKHILYFMTKSVIGREITAKTGLINLKIILAHDFSKFQKCSSQPSTTESHLRLSRH